LTMSYFYIKCPMQLYRPYSLREIAELIQKPFIGDPDHVVSGINEIHSVVSGDLVFVDHSKYYQKALNSAATTILIDQEVACPKGKGLIISSKPFDDFNKLTRHFQPTNPVRNTIGQNCSIDPSAFIHPSAVIGHKVKIGKDVMIHAGVVISNECVIDDRVIIGPNSVIGQTAFYYKKKADGYDRMHTCGSVHLHDDVEIGALCTIDAGVTGITRIGRGTKIDNQVHVGHDTVIGSQCLFAANVGIAGCVRIEDNVVFWGQVGCASDVTIGKDAIVLAQSGITKDLEGGKTYFGSPCSEVREKYRELAALRQLPRLLEKLK
jgi:UDP-3-O-[3-hydroxymyristoyl] glucosamine N-acyltransferase